MEDNLILEESNIDKPKRSKFLNVLCTLSFIMCAMGFLSGSWSIYQSKPEAMEKNIEQIRQVKPELANQMETNMIEMQSKPFNKIAPYLGLVYTLVSFLGVLLMWNKVKKGFYIYAIAEILPYTSFIFMGKNSLNMMGPSGGNNSAVAMGVLIFMVVVDVIFVSMYAKNLNEMDK